MGAIRTTVKRAKNARTRLLRDAEIICRPPNPEIHGAIPFSPSHQRLVVLPVAPAITDKTRCVIREMDRRGIRLASSGIVAMSLHHESEFAYK